MSRDIERWEKVAIHLSSFELAEVFWEMDAEEQAGFFHRLSEVSEGGLAMQLQNVADSEHTTTQGRAVMSTIGAYADAMLRGPDEVNELRASHAADEVRISELKGLLRKLHSDLLMRAEVDADGVKVVNLSNGLWCRVAQLTEQEQKP